VRAVAPRNSLWARTMLRSPACCHARVHRRFMPGAKEMRAEVASAKATPCAWVSWHDSERSGARQRVPGTCDGPRVRKRDAHGR